MRSQRENVFDIGSWSVEDFSAPGADRASSVGGGVGNAPAYGDKLLSRRDVPTTG